MDLEGTVKILTSANKKPTLVLNGDRGDLSLGANGQEGAVELLDAQGQRRISLAPNANGARLEMHDSNQNLVVNLQAALNVAVLGLGGSGFDGSILIKNAAGKISVQVSGRDGDVILDGADACEDFDVVQDGVELMAGTVMVIDTGGQLRESTEAYDCRVAGVLSGAGNYRPGIILGRGQAAGFRRPLALIGKVFCRVDASLAPIEVGNLLTSSQTPGHAMRATDPLRAFGAVIGKSLESLPAGQGLIPILVGLQ